MVTYHRFFSTESLHFIGLEEKLASIGLLSSECKIQTKYEDLKTEIKTKSKELTKAQYRKIGKAEKKLDDLERDYTKKKLTPDEAVKRLKVLESEEEAIIELKDQSREYKKIVGVLTNRLERLGKDATSEKLQKLQNDFQIECNRLDFGLPIYAKRSNILSLIRKTPVTILTAETGSGKSTQVVQYLHEVDENANIVCTQPRKVAATSLAVRVSEELLSTVGHLVGYRTGPRGNFNKSTKIIYMTDHTLLNECLVDPDLKKYKYIIVDEAHERSIATDLLLAMVKKALAKRKSLRLIISSATIDPTIFATYFGGMAQYIHVHGRTFPVDAIYEKVSIGKEYLQISVEKAKKIHKSEGDGDVLVFLTTPAETERAQECMLADLSIRDSIVCLVLHGRLQPEDQQLVFEQTPRGKRKIVFATNSAETSITIPNIRYVVDSGMVKEKQYDREKNVSQLKIASVNKSSAEQRMGRAGRTHPGKCYRLYTEEDYISMDDEMKPEILRENLGLAMLKLYQFDIDDPFQYDFVEAPPEAALEYAKKEIEMLGAIVNNKLTYHGKIMATLDIEPKLGKFVALSIEEDIGYDAMVIAAVSSIGGSVFFRAGSEEEKQIADRLKARFCHQEGDLYTMLAVFKEWVGIDERSKNKWCVDNSMNAKSLRFTRDLVKEMKRNMESILNEEISNEFSEDSKIRWLIPKLLADCFRYSLAHFSGHQRGGYFRPGWGYDRFYVHPSSSLSFLGLNPDWILFTEVLTTNRPYLLNTMVIPNRIAERMVSNSIKMNPIKMMKTWIVGKEIAKILGFGRWQCQLEKQMQEEISQHIYIDFDTNTGEVSLHCSRETVDEAIRVLGEAIDYERKWIDRKLLDIPLSEGNTTCVLLQKGGLCQNLLFQGEFNSLKLKGITDSTRKETVELFFEKFGKITEIIQFRSPYWWGKVCFKNAEDALNAKQNYRRVIYEEEFFEFENLFAQQAFNNATMNSAIDQSCSVKMFWTRRRAKGNFAFITFKSVTVYNEFLGKQSTVVGDRWYCFKRSNQSLSLKVSGIDPNVSETELKLSFMNQFPEFEDEFEKFVIPRAPCPLETKDKIDAQRRQVRNKIRNLLQQEDGSKDNFRLEINPVRSEKQNDYEAKVSFKDARHAKIITNAIITVTGAKVRMVPELKSQPFYISNTLYHLIKENLETQFNEMDDATLEINQNVKGKAANVELAVEANEMENLTKTTKALQDLVKGEHVQFAEHQFRYFLTPLGHEFIESLKKENSCIINIDKRVRSIVIFGNRTIRQKVKMQVEEKKALINLNEDDWVMRLDSMPIGFIKKLIKTYKINLESLYNSTGVSYIEVNFVRRIIKFTGSNESLIGCKSAMDEIAAQMGVDVDRIVDRRGECPICFDVLETASHQLELCTHSYCKECFQMMCQNALQSKELPMKCAKDDCDQLISINDMLEHLEAKDIVPVAVEQLVAQHGDRYKYCLTPDCLNVYVSSTQPDPDPFHCVVCQAHICAYCDAEYHPGLRCYFSQRKDDDNLKQWLAENQRDRGLCPKCSAPIERSDGCLHITCSLCKGHVCWRCKTAVFDSSGECYDHLGLCGGIFL